MGLFQPSARTRQRRETGTALLLLLPLFVLVVGLIGYPFYRAVWLSFTDKLVGYPERWVGLRNYIYLVNDDTFRTVVRNSLVFTVASVALKILTGIAMALVLNATWRWRNFFRGLLLLPWITSTVIIALTWRWMFDAFPGRGFFNSVLLDAGLLSRPIAFMATPEGAMAAVVIANWWRGFPFFGVSYLAGMQSIPGELYEAAEMDGANAWQKFRVVTVTFLRPAMLPYAIYGFVITFNLFFLPFFMTGGEPFGRTEILVTQAYRLVNERQLYGVAAAFCVYLFFLLLVVTLITNRLAKATKSYAE